LNRTSRSWRACVASTGKKLVLEILCPESSRAASNLKTEVWNQEANRSLRDPTAYGNDAPLADIGFRPVSGRLVRAGRSDCCSYCLRLIPDACPSSSSFAGDRQHIPPAGLEHFCPSPAWPDSDSQTMATDCHRNLLLRSNANLLFILLQRPEKVIHRRGVHSGPAVAGEVALRVDTKIEPKKISRPDFRSRLNLS
jgi:hypothetical protein